MIFQDLYDAVSELLGDQENRKDLQQCGASVNQLFESTLQAVSTKSYDELLTNVDALIDYSNETILTFHFKDVPEHWRRMLIDAGLLKVLIQLGSLTKEANFETIEPKIQLIIHDLDVCSVVSGSPGVDRRFLCNIILDQLQQYLSNHRTTMPELKKRKRAQATTKKADTELLNPIKRLPEIPSFEWFLQHCNTEMPEPFIIPKGVIDDWPASRLWGSMDYLLSVAADRVVPVEIGSQYTDVDWGQKMMRFSEFINSYILKETDPPAYLAQHDVFYQIPRLERDILIPDYCYIEPKLTRYYEARINQQEVIKNAWFGPKGTISPLHQDPYHNLLAQVVGSKYLKLISPDQTQLVYPREGLMTNTSQVDMESPNHEQFPRFREANYLDCILKEGEILYIPPKWWHFVKSLETSFSVSLWF